MMRHMIGKSGKHWKADWPKHLSELVHAHNSVRSAIMRYSPHYFMFGCWLCLPINFYFPMVRGTQKYWHVNHYVTELCEICDTFKEAYMQSTSEVERQKWHYNRKTNAISWRQVTWSWLNPTPIEGEESWRIDGRRNCRKWSARLQKASLPTSCRPDAHESITEIDFFLIALTEGPYLCMVVQAKRARGTTLEEHTQKSETEEEPQSVNCPLLAQCQTGKTSLGWLNRKLHTFIQMFPRASWIDKGWNFNVEG